MSFGGGGSPFFFKGSSHPPSSSGAPTATASNAYQSYQNSSSATSLFGSSVNPLAPSSSTDKKTDDTYLLASTLSLNFDALNTSALVISQLSAQRSQLDRALENTAVVKAITSRCQDVLVGMRRDARRRRMKLYAIIAALAMLDAFIFYRLVVCGSLVCRR